MGSVNNNWLAFSLSPHLNSVEMAELDASHATQVTSSSMNLMSSTRLSQASMDFNVNSSRQELVSDTSSPSTQTPEMSLRSDASLCIIEALKQSNGEEWGMKSLEHSQITTDAGRPGVQSQFFSEHVSDTGSQYGMGQMKRQRRAVIPKLEDFLEGAYLGEQYAPNKETNSSDLETICYGNGSSLYSNQDSSLNTIMFHRNKSSYRDLQRSIPFGVTNNKSQLASRPLELQQQTLGQQALTSQSVHISNATTLNQSYKQYIKDNIVSSDCRLQLNQTSGGMANGQNLLGLSVCNKSWLPSENPPDSTAKTSVNASSGCSISVATKDYQSLSLSMTPNNIEHSNRRSQSAIVFSQYPAPNCESSTNDLKRTSADKPSVDKTAPRKCIDTFGQRTSSYRGVTRHRWTGRYEAHLWDNTCRREGQTRKGRQVYLGGYDIEEKAARSYDLAALKYWGPTTAINFCLSDYEKELEEMKHMTRQEFVASLRRNSSGFSRGASKYRGVTKHHQHGRWQARIGRVSGNKDLYLGTYTTQEEAAEAYDIAAIKFRGVNAVTNFDMSRYDIAKICSRNSFDKNAVLKCIKDESIEICIHGRNHDEGLSIQTEAGTSYGSAGQEWQFIKYLQQPNEHQSSQPRSWGKHEQEKADYSLQHSLQQMEHKFMQITLPPATIGHCKSGLQMHNVMNLHNEKDINGNEGTKVYFGNLLAGNGFLMGNSNSEINLSNTQRLSMDEDEQLMGTNSCKNLLYLQHLTQGEAMKSSCNNDSSGNWTAPAISLSTKSNPTVYHAPIFSTWDET